MKEQQLKRALAWFREKPGRVAALRGVNALCTWGTVAAFGAECARLALQRDPALLRLALTCGVPLAALTLLREKLDRPRPYEVYGLEPLIPKETRGKSFPSRHVYSICVIGTSLMYLDPPLGALLLALGALLSAARVVSGVHFPKDVLAGALIGVLCAVAGFGIIP